MNKPALLLICWVLAGQYSHAGWWEDHADPGQWAHDRDNLGEALRNKAALDGPAGWKPDSPTEQQFRLWQWLGEWPGLEGQNAKEFAELGGQSELIRAYFENIQPEDRRPQVLRILMDLQSQAPQEIKELPRLAVALALVFDQPLPRDWPHPQVPAQTLPRQDVNVSLRLKDMAQLQFKRKYAFDLVDLTVSEAKFLVDHPLPESELEWARKNVTTSRSSFEKVFESIRYDTGRIQAKQYNWPFPSYRLEDIKKQGGICVDQAYFAAMTGKAKGIPTLLFVGQGDNGGHAWFGYLESLGRWKNDCGRYQQERYTVGIALDPQTWAPITDAELDFIANSRERSETYRQVKLWTDFAANFKEPEAEAFIDEALRVQPDFLPAWEYKGKLVEDGSDNKPRKGFWEAFVKRFYRYPELRVRGQERLLAIAKSEGDVTSIKSYEKQILTQNRTQRFDLSIDSVFYRLEEYISAGDWNQADAEYRQALRELKGQAGGQLFYSMIRPFVLAAMEAKQFAIAKKSVMEAKRTLRAEKGSLVAIDLLELERLVDQTTPKK